MPLAPLALKPNTMTLPVSAAADGGEIMAMPGPLPFNLKLAFGVGQAAEGLKNGAFGTFLIFYYNQVLGMPGTLAGHRHRHLR